MNIETAEVIKMLWNIGLTVLITTALKIVITLIVNWIFNKKIGKFRSRAKRFQLLKKLINGVLSTIYWTVLVIIVLQLIGLSSVITALITFAGVGSLVIGLAAQDIFKDLIAGFILLTENKLGYDDYVKINGIEGVVEEIKLRNVYIRTYSGQLVSIPSGEINVIFNYARGNAKAITEVLIPFSEDIDEVKRAVLEAGERLKSENAQVLTSPVMAGITEVASNGYRVRVYVETAGMQYWGVQRALNEYVIKNLQSRNIRILVPSGVKLMEE